MYLCVKSGAPERRLFFPQSLRQSLKECAYFIADHGVKVNNIFSDRLLLGGTDRAYKEFDKQASGKGVFVF
jgi:hypothetical protein